LRFSRTGDGYRHVHAYPGPDRRRRPERSDGRIVAEGANGTLREMLGIGRRGPGVL